jgi:hypothetical protein
MAQHIMITFIKRLSRFGYLSEPSQALLNFMAPRADITLEGCFLRTPVAAARPALMFAGHATARHVSFIHY